MRVVTEQREFDDEHQAAPPPAPVRLGGTDIFRGGMVILVAVVIGALVISRGLVDEPEAATEAAGAADQEEAAAPDPAAGAAEGTDGSVPADGQQASGGSDGAGTGAATDAADGTAGSTGSAEAGSAATPGTVTPSGDAGTTTTTPLTTVRSPSDVKVLVLNGAGTQGIAAKGTEMLTAASYVMAAPKNADANGPSGIYHVEGYDVEARAVAAVFGPDLDALVQPLTADNQPVDDLQGAAIVVVLGTDDAIPLA
jgi:hypothetical protein